jgi:hypothetical protein
MSERSTLSLRVRPHFHPDRQEDIVVEVMREGEVAATIYGSREGIQVVSERFEPERGGPNRVFYMQVGETSSVVVPLLRPGEPCPWCADGVEVRPCPVCGKEQPI